MAVVTKTIGTTGRDYSTIESWEADLDNAGIYSAADDAVGDVYDDGVYNTANVTINGGATIGLTSVTLKAATGEGHDGTSGTGVRMTKTLSVIASSSGPHLTVKHIDIDGNSGAISAYLLSSSGAPNVDVTLSRFLVHNLSDTGFGWGVSLSTSSATPCNMYFHDSMVYDLDHTGTSTEQRGVTGTTISTSRVIKLQNVTVHNCQNSNGGNANHPYGIKLSDIANSAIQNCLVTDTVTAGSGTPTDYFTSSYSNATVDHDLASDTTASGTGSLDSKTAGNQFVSTARGSEDLHLKTGADAIDAGVDLGTTPSGVEIDIDGRDRDASADTWDMGADEFVSAGGSTVPALDEGMLVGGLQPLSGGLE